MSDKKILITGGSGFIGTNLVEYYLQHEWVVLNLDIAPPRNKTHLPYWKKVDILNKQPLLEYINEFKPHFVLHFAARTDLKEKKDIKGYAVNIDGVLNIINSIKITKSVQRIMFASSQLVCQIGYQPLNDLDYCPTTLYGKSKVLGEKTVLDKMGSDTEWIIVRPTSIWGPWFDAPYKYFFLSIARNFYAHPKGITVLKQWGFVGNTVHQINELLNMPYEKIDRKIYYLADYEPLNLLYFANYVRRFLGKKSVHTFPIEWLSWAAKVGDFSQKLGWNNPPLSTYRLHNMITNEIQKIEPLKLLVGPLPYTLDKGVELTLQWLNSQGLLPEVKPPSHAP